MHLLGSNGMKTTVFISIFKQNFVRKILLMKRRLNNLKKYFKLEILHFCFRIWTSSKWVKGGSATPCVCWQTLSSTLCPSTCQDQGSSPCSSPSSSWRTWPCPCSTPSPSTSSGPSSGSTSAHPIKKQRGLTRPLQVPISPTMFVVNYTWKVRPFYDNFF